jgi:hypothetical protein
MRNWLRHWLGIAEQGSLTFLPNGNILVGCPPETDRDTAEAVGRQLLDWAASGQSRVLVLPFPVTVVDRRTEVTHV